jgi:hypothetical protein
MLPTLPSKGPTRNYQSKHHGAVVLWVDHISPGTRGYPFEAGGTLGKGGARVAEDGDAVAGTTFGAIAYDIEPLDASASVLKPPKRSSNDELQKTSFTRLPDRMCWQEAAHLTASLWPPLRWRVSE